MCSQYKILPNVRFFFLIKLAIDLIYIIYIILIFANMSAFILIMEQDEGWTLVKRSEYADIKYSAIERHLLFQVEVVKMIEYISFCFLTIGKLELVEIFLNFNEEMTSSSFGELDFNARLMNSIIHLQFLSNFYLSRQ